MVSRGLGVVVLKTRGIVAGMACDRVWPKIRFQAWLPDGQSIAFFKGADCRQTALVIHYLSSGEERTVPTKQDNVIH